MTFFLKKISNLSSESFISDGDNYYDYKTINEKIEKLKYKHKLDGLILNVATNSLDFLIGYLFFFESSSPQLMIDRHVGIKNLNLLVIKFKPSFIFIPVNFKNYFECEIVFELEDYVLIRTNYNSVNIDKKIAFLMPTSGSTGDQKFAKISFNNVKNNTKNILKYLKLKNSDCTITTLQPSYSYGISVLNTHLLAKSSIILTDYTLVQKEFWRLYNKYPITNFNGVPILYNFLIKFGLNKLYKKSLKFFTSAGGSLDKKILIELINFIEKKKLKYYSMYGQTEASPRISFLLYPNFKNKIESIGKAIPGGKLSIKNKELIYKGKNIFGGYANNWKDLSKFRSKNNLNTGDLGYHDKNGFFYITGRVKRIAKIYGIRISLDLVEKQLKDLGIQCAIISKNNIIYIHLIKKINHDKIFINLFENFKITKNILKIKYIKKFPNTKNNKINYTILEKKA